MDAKSIMVVKLVGIDLATIPQKCGVCVLEDSVVTYVGRGAARARHPEWLVEHCQEANVVAIDVPFGWPIPFIRDLRDYEIGVALDRERRQYTYRTTDAWIADELPELLQRTISSPNPSSVSADKIGATAMVGTLLLNCLSSISFSVSTPRDRHDPSVIEVYPAASLWAWDLPHGQNIDVEEVFDALVEASGLTVRPPERTTLLASRHCLDALIAALTGHVYLNGNTFDPPDCVSEDELEVEGWIRVPTATLRRLARDPDASSTR